MLEPMISDKRRLRIAKVADQTPSLKYLKIRTSIFFRLSAYFSSYQVVSGFAIFNLVKIRNNMPSQYFSWPVAASSFRNGQWET